MNSVSHNSVNELNDFRKNSAVTVSPDLSISIGVPVNTTLPPFRPPSGPRSIIQSEAFITPLVMLNDNHRITGINHSVQKSQKILNINGVQSGSRLVH